MQWQSSSTIQNTIGQLVLVQEKVSWERVYKWMRPKAKMFCQPFNQNVNLGWHSTLVDGLCLTENTWFLFSFKFRFIKSYMDSFLGLKWWIGCSLPAWSSNHSKSSVRHQQTKKESIPKPKHSTTKTPITISLTFYYDQKEWVHPKKWETAKRLVPFHSVECDCFYKPAGQPLYIGRQQSGTVAISWWFGSSPPT